MAHKKIIVSSPAALDAAREIFDTALDCGEMMQTEQAIAAIIERHMQHRDAEIKKRLRLIAKTFRAAEAAGLSEGADSPRYLAALGRVKAAREYLFDMLEM